MKPLTTPLQLVVPSIADDHALMAKIALGDESAYALLVNRHLGRAVGFAAKMLGNRGDAEDVAQEAFFKVWTEAARWQPKALFSTWFYRVLYNLCIDTSRKRKAPHVEIDEDLADDRISIEQELTERQTAQRVQNAMQKLPDRQRAALVMFHYEELSQTETAQALGISESALESLLFRARQALKEELSQ